MDSIDHIRSRNKRQLIDGYTIVASTLALGTSAYNTLQIAGIRETEQQLIERIQTNDKILQSTVANIISLTENQAAIVEELNQTHHSMVMLQDRLLLLYNQMKTLEKTLRVILEQFIPSIQADIHYDKIARSLDDLSHGKKNVDYLSREELRHLTNTVFNRSKKNY
ncbi:unnamed protein product, partial [Didymodactylos carnosus]